MKYVLMFVTMMALFYFYVPTFDKCELIPNKDSSKYSCTDYQKNLNKKLYNY